MENFDSKIENDPTVDIRETLVSELQSVATEADAKLLEKFKKGVFFVPSETTSRILELIEMAPEEKRERMLNLYIDITEQGL
jgi:hypothetical protein